MNGDGSRPGDGRPDVAEVLSRLKGFQRATAEHAFERLYLAADSTRRFLVADEVGLGKTLVARGVIAKAIDHLWEDIERIDIVYICSNTQIARQNVNRLRMAGGGEFVAAERLTMLPTKVRGLRKNRVNYLAFTPGTSFDLKSSLGRKEERVLLYSMLQGIWPIDGTPPMNFFQGWVGDSQKFRRELRDFDRDRIDPDLAADFARRLVMPAEGGELGGEELRKEYERLCRVFETFHWDHTRETRAAQARVIGRFRTLLAETCVRALEPDLVILDEFQSFRHILAGEGEGADDGARLARQLFDYAGEEAEVRLLLLSATPYKMYTLCHERDEDDHYQDFLRTMEFLDSERPSGAGLRDHLAAYRRELFRAADDATGLVAAKERIEQELRRLMCRTERLRGSEARGDMLRQVEVDGVDLTPDDVESFVALSRIGVAVGQPSVLEYWKSAPYLLSFMDGYQLKRAVADRMDRPEADERLEALLREASGAVLDWDEVERYEELDPRNARLRSLLGWVEEHELWKLLWLPPALSYYQPGEPFRGTTRAGLSKRLVFSSWTVVPKAVASLVSYQVERLAFRSDEGSPSNSTEEQRKRQRPLLRFTQSQGRLTGMPVLGMLYPSFVLVDLGDPVACGRAARARGELATVPAVLEEIEARLEGRLARLAERHTNLEADREDEAWYWAAPILLDLEARPDAAREWLLAPDLAQRWSGEEDEDEESRWADHVGRAAELAAEGIPLGRPPEDLARVLAMLALAGPAVCALRALTRAYGGAAAAFRPQARQSAARIAWSFRTLFNLPEAKAVVRAGRRDGELPYWRQVLEYSASGQLQAVLDEYVHILRDLEGLFDMEPEKAVSRLAERIRDALSLRTGTPAVDEIAPAPGATRARIERRRMRNRFAVRFGAQESEDGKAGAREDQVRTAFNSPFWPFVLVSTSVGQEGLDFHPYCHAVMHWNLPSNPVDLEQREGRVHRYKGHAVRKNVASAFGGEILAGDGTQDPWAELFELARARAPGSGHGLLPYWLFPLDDGAFIERHVPLLPLSREVHQLENLRRTLAVYRMVFGQPRQDDLMVYLLGQLTEERLQELVPLLQIDLTPP